MRAKNLLFLFIGISIFIAAYLYYIDRERKMSVQQYFGQPAVGDIYKIKKDDDEGTPWVHYMKVTEITTDYLVFQVSKMMSNTSADYLLNHYDTTAPVIYTRKELMDIKNGKWNNFQKDNTSLIEIVRKEER